MTEADYPALYNAAGRLSQSSQRKFFAALLAHLILLTVGAALSVLNSPCAAVAWLQAAVLLVALGCSILLFNTRPEKVWYSARALAESVKTLSWRYVCQAEPFNTAHDVSKSLFVEKLKLVLKQNQDIAGKFTDHLNGSQLTPAMEAIRGKTLLERKLTYLDFRITDQLNWYSDKSKSNGLKGAVFFWILILLNCIAVGFALAKIKYAYAPIWPTDIFIAAGACVLTWMQAKRFAELSSAYALTAVEITFLKDDALKPPDEKSFSDFVGDAENAFSREHTQWIARKDMA